MASVEAAERAINALTNTTPPGGMQSLIVRFAESAAEKAARLSRRERQQLLQRNGFGGDVNLGGLDPLQLQQAMTALALTGGLGVPNGVGMPHGGGMLRGTNPGMGPPPMVAQQYQAAVQSSICVKGMPTTADRLWLYENFARFGAIAGMRILIDEQTGLCNGTAFINYGDPLAAQRARQAMSGMRAGDKILHVVVQQQQQTGQRQGSANNLSGGGSSMGPAMVGLGALPGGGDQGDWQMLQSGVGNGMVW